MIIALITLSLIPGALCWELPSGHPRVSLHGSARDLAFTGPGALPLTRPACPLAGPDTTWSSLLQIQSATPDWTALGAATAAGLQAELAKAADARSVKDNSLTGPASVQRESEIRQATTEVQMRQFSNSHDDGGPHKCLHRMVHSQTLWGGQVDIHWSPAFQSHFKSFAAAATPALARISGASSKFRQDGEDLFGFAMAIKGTGGVRTDLLLLGGDVGLEASRPNDSKQQMLVFNLVDAPNSIAAAWKVVRDLGPVEAGKLVSSLGLMASPASLVQKDFVFWSRTPYRLTDNDGVTRLVKFRLYPANADFSFTPVKGEGMNERLVREMAGRVRSSSVAWNFDLQIFRPTDDPEMTSEKWSGPWLTVGQVVAQKVEDENLSQRFAQAVEREHFNIWTNKFGAGASSNPDLNVFFPHGEANQARLWAYTEAHANRGKANTRTSQEQDESLLSTASIEDPSEKAKFALIGAGSALLGVAVFSAIRSRARAPNQEQQKSVVSSPEI